MKRSAFVEHDRVALSTPGPSMTRQEFQAECDINQIMRRYEKTGVISHVARRVPQYLDVSETPDLQSALNMLERATEAFMSLPANVRKRFDNDPSEFVKFASDVKNLDQMREWGLAPPRETLPEAASPLESGGKAPAGERDTPASGKGV